MIRTDGRPTIAMRESDPLPGQMTVEDCIKQAEIDELEAWWRNEQEQAEPIYGGHN